MSNDIPIHSCQGNASTAQVMRKTGLYSNEVLCQILAGTLGTVNRSVNALELASVICEVLEAQRERDNPEPDEKS